MQTSSIALPFLAAGYECTPTAMAAQLGDATVLQSLHTACPCLALLSHLLSSSKLLPLIDLKYIAEFPSTVLDAVSPYGHPLGGKI